jgi:hypothetical protein
MRKRRKKFMYQLLDENVRVKLILQAQFYIQVMASFRTQDNVQYGKWW